MSMFSITIFVSYKSYCTYKYVYVFIRNFNITISILYLFYSFQCTIGIQEVHIFLNTPTPLKHWTGKKWPAKSTCKHVLCWKQISYNDHKARWGGANKHNFFRNTLFPPYCGETPASPQFSWLELFTEYENCFAKILYKQDSQEQILAGRYSIVIADIFILAVRRHKRGEGIIEDKIYSWNKNNSVFTCL